MPCQHVKYFVQLGPIRVSEGSIIYIGLWKNMHVDNMLFRNPSQYLRIHLKMTLCGCVVGKFLHQLSVNHENDTSMPPNESSMMLQPAL